MGAGRPGLGCGSEAFPVECYAVYTHNAHHTTKLEAVRCTLDNRVLGTAVSESIWATISIRAISMSTHNVLKTQGHVLRRPFEVIRGTPSQDAARGNTQNCMSARDVSDTQNSYRLELVVLKTRWQVSVCAAPLPDGTARIRGRTRRPTARRLLQARVNVWEGQRLHRHRCASAGIQGAKVTTRIARHSGQELLTRAWTFSSQPLHKA